MNDLVQGSLLLGAFINCVSASFCARVIGRFGSTWVNWVLFNLVMCLGFFLVLGAYMVLALVYAPQLEVSPRNILIEVACLVLNLAGFYSARRVKREIEAKEAVKGKKGGRP